MNKIGKIALVALLTKAILYPLHATEEKSTPLVCSFSDSSSCMDQIKSNFVSSIQSKVLKTIESSNDIPGLRSDEFCALKSELVKTWETLVENGAYQLKGTDREVRGCFVALQAVIEQVLAAELQKEITSLTGVIHTPLPATPLCTTGAISKELVDPSIESDPSRSFTVKVRSTILRDYLFKGGDLYIIYPKEGLQNRTAEQRAIYQQELINYSTHLFDTPLNCEAIPSDLIGATYLFQDRLGKPFVFAIQMTQAKDPQERGNFGLWFGPLDHSAIQDRIRAVSSFLVENGSNVLN